MRVRLKHVHKTRKRLADGSIREYFYAWRGGPPIEGKPGSPEFIASYNAAVADRRVIPDGTLFSLIAEWRASAEFQKLSSETRASYASYARLIEDAFGDMPLAALDDPRVRGDFRDWRDGFAATPRKADLAWTVLARILSVAKDRGRIRFNPCEKGGRLYKAKRQDCIWTEDDIGRFIAVASRELRLALLMALWTGQRKKDLLMMQWSAFDGRCISLRQFKSKAVVIVPVGEPLKAELNMAERVSTTILCSSARKPWTNSGFNSSWKRAFNRSGITEDLHFHDLRGTAITRLALAGCTHPEIASVTGHSLATVAAMLDNHYLGGRAALAENAIHKLERGTKTVNRL